MQTSAARLPSDRLRLISEAGSMNAVMVFFPLPIIGLVLRALGTRFLCTRIWPAAIGQSSRMNFRRLVDQLLGPARRCGVGSFGSASQSGNDQCHSINGAGAFNVIALCGFFSALFIPSALLVLTIWPLPADLSKSGEFPEDVRVQPINTTDYTPLLILHDSVDTVNITNAGLSRVLVSILVPGFLLTTLIVLGPLANSGSSGLDATIEAIASAAGRKRARDSDQSRSSHMY